MNVTLTAKTAATKVPVNISPAGVTISLTDAAGNAVNDANGAPLGPVSLAKGPYATFFSNVVDGDYVATAAAVDSTGATIGTPVTQAFTLTTTPSGPTVTLPTPAAAMYDAPVSFDITVS